MTPTFYLQKTNASGAAVGSAISLESNFSGLKYLSCKGLEARGEVKNIYTEDYADYNGVRAFHPSDVNASVTRKSTDIKLTLLFTGDNRRSVYTNFVTYITSSRFYWWDTVRNKKAWIMHKASSEPSEDIVNGMKYIKVEFTFINIWGETKTCNNSGVIQ